MTKSRQPWIRWPDRRDTKMGFGGDYNPEQWDEATWRDDVRLMKEAGVNLVNVAVFGWSHLEPSPGRYEFGLYDRVLDLLHENAIAVDLATGTASPPAWLVEAHPEMLPVTADGVVQGFGARQSWCPSSPVYREHSIKLVHAVATHFADHPALALWHVSNELGCHNARCFCDVSNGAFRDWLRTRYSDLAALNHAWGTAFWSQRYTAWEQIGAPRTAPSFPNPTQQLDFMRFSSDALRDQLVAERDVLRSVTPDVPVTTNFMVMGNTKNMDYAAWAPEVDVVSNDHYLVEGDRESHIELAFSADLVRGLSGGAPWMLMEQSSSAVNWGQINRAKRPGQMRRNSLAQVARGADAISYFQWRASKAGAEKYHSAMLPHAGADTRVHREVRALGADLSRLSDVVGSRVSADVAILFDWPSWWSSELDSHPSQEFRYRDVALQMYRALWRRNITADVLPPTAELDGYKLVVVPALHMVDDETAARIAALAERGATVLVTYFSGIVDQNDHIRTGGYPGAFRDMLGVRAEEFDPLGPDQEIRLLEGSVATRWSEDLKLIDATPVRTYAEGPLARQAAATRRNLPSGGSAWYLATTLTDEDLSALFEEVCSAAEVSGHGGARGIEIVRRESPEGQTFTFAINHNSATARPGIDGHCLLSGKHYDVETCLPPGEVAVVRDS